MRDLMASGVAPILKATGFRFSKAWRQAESGTLMGFVYARMLNTTLANQLAGL